MRLFITFLLITLLTACATMQPPPAATSQTMDWNARRMRLATIQQWHINGALGLRTSRQAFSGSFVWQQQPNQYVLQTFGPLGTYSMRLVGSTTGVILQTAADKRYQANDPESLLKQQLGWDLPVSNLYYWIRGIPAPAIPAATRLDKQNHLLQLAQQGWNIEYQGYQNVNGIDLPNRLVLTNPSVSIRIVIKNWNI